MTDSTPPTAAPKPPRLTAADGCFGYFLGSLMGVLVTMAWTTGRLAGLGASVLALIVLALLFRRATRSPVWVRFAWSIAIGLATLGLLFGLCVASFSHMDFR